MQAMGLRANQSLSFVMAAADALRCVLLPTRTMRFQQLREQLF
jgi:hypothetical protein